MTRILPTYSVIYLEPKTTELILNTRQKKVEKIYSKSLQEALSKNSLRDARPYEAILLDYNSPDRNGLEVAKEIVTINTDQRIILVSAYDECTGSASKKK